jgi:ribosomal protein L36
MNNDRMHQGTTILKAICPDCKAIAKMTVKSVMQVCSSVEITCKNCSVLSVVYRRGEDDS